MRIRVQLVVCAAAVMVALVVGASPQIAVAVQEPGAGSQPGSAGEPIPPVAVEQIEPCCESTHSDEQPRRVSGRVAVPRGQMVDPATYLRLKEEAALDPRVPRGTEVGFVEESESLAAAPRVRSKFEGLDANTGFIPPDTIVAAGPNEVLEAVNSALRLSSRANTDVKTQTLNDHFGVKSSPLFDPKVYFDRLSNRFFIVALFRTERLPASFIYLSVSQSSSVVSLEKGRTSTGAAATAPGITSARKPTRWMT